MCSWNPVICSKSEDRQFTETFLSYWNPLFIISAFILSFAKRGFSLTTLGSRGINESSLTHHFSSFSFFFASTSPPLPRHLFLYLFAWLIFLGRSLSWKWLFLVRLKIFYFSSQVLSVRWWRNPVFLWLSGMATQPSCKVLLLTSAKMTAHPVVCIAS